MSERPQAHTHNTHTQAHRAGNNAFVFLRNTTSRRTHKTGHDIMRLMHTAQGTQAQTVSVYVCMRACVCVWSARGDAHGLEVLRVPGGAGSAHHLASHKSVDQRTLAHVRVADGAYHHERRFKTRVRYLSSIDTDSHRHTQHRHRHTTTTQTHTTSTLKRT